jgi:hypothetical protein
MALTRPLANVAAVALIAIGLVVLLPDCASACSCAYAGAPGELTYSSAVFSGEVVDFDMKGPFNATAILRVSEVWKGPERGTLEVHTRDPAFCGYRFKEGQEYLVYAEGGPGYPADRFVVKNCGRTRLLSKAGADLEVLGDGAAVGDDGDAVLSDTSGGSPPLGVMGMLGGAVAAVSLVVLIRLVRTG